MTREKNEEAKKQGWLVLDNGTILFPRIFTETPCKNHAMVGRFCRFTPCKFKHGSFPGDYPKADQKVICHLVDNTQGAKFARCVKASDLAELRSPKPAGATPGDKITSSSA